MSEEVKSPLQDVEVDDRPIKFSSNAALKVLEFGEAHGQVAKPLRVYVQGGRTSYDYGFKFDDKRDNDIEIAQDGFSVIVDGFSLHLLRGATVDYADSLTGGGFTVDNPNEPDRSSDPLFAQVKKVIDEQINPGVATHGGTVTLLDVNEGIAYVELGGGCQGCGMVDVTLKQGIERMLKEQIPQIQAVYDTTDHAAGGNPYFTQAKGG